MRTIIFLLALLSSTGAYAGTSLAKLVKCASIFRDLTDLSSDGIVWMATETKGFANNDGPQLVTVFTAKDIYQFTYKAKAAHAQIRLTMDHKTLIVDRDGELGDTGIADLYYQQPGEKFASGEVEKIKAKDVLDSQQKNRLINAVGEAIKNADFRESGDARHEMNEIEKKCGMLTEKKIVTAIDAFRKKNGYSPDSSPSGGNPQSSANNANDNANK